jgi:hypothetical protein
MLQSVDLSPLWPVINTAVITLAGGVIIFMASWATWLLHKYAPPFVGAQLEAKASADLNRALQNGVTAGMNALQLWEKAHSDLTVQNAITRWAAQYAIDLAPDAIEHFGLSPDQLAFKALAFLPAPKTTGDTTGATVKTEPVSVATPR